MATPIFFVINLCISILYVLLLKELLQQKTTL